MSTTDSLNVRNSSPSSITFALEPWGSTFEMVPGAVFTVTARSVAPGHFEVVHLDASTVAVYVWADDDLKVAVHSGETLLVEY